MKILSVGQRKSLSAIFGNTAVAWFVGGILNPLLNQSPKQFDILFNIVISLIMSLVFIYYSLDTVKTVKT